MSDKISDLIDQLERKMMLKAHKDGMVTNEDFLIEIGKEQERLRILDILLHTLDFEDYRKVREAIK